MPGRGGPGSGPPPPAHPGEAAGDSGPAHPLRAGPALPPGWSRRRAGGPPSGVGGRGRGCCCCCCCRRGAASSSPAPAGSRRLLLAVGPAAAGLEDQAGAGASPGGRRRRLQKVPHCLNTDETEGQKSCKGGLWHLAGYFGPQKTQNAGEKKADTNPGLSGAASKSDCNPQGHGSLKGERSKLAASPFPPLREFKPVQHHAHRASAPSNRRWMDQAKGGKSAPKDDNLDFTQHLEANGVAEYTAASRSPLRDRNSDWRTPSTLYSQTSQSLKVLSTRFSYSKSRLSDSSDSENTDPPWERSGTAMKRKGFNQNRRGIPSERVMALCVSDKRPENSQPRCTTPLFSQDSEGHIVISHRFSGEQGNLCLLKEPSRNKSNRGTSPAYRDCLGACFPAESGSQVPAGAEIRLNSCYDLLFTEDSEGNRVIKH